MPEATWRYKLTLFLAFAVAYGIFYIVPNFRPVSEPLLLPLLWPDRFFPLIPWTFWVYLSDYLMVLVTISMYRDKASFDSFARMAFATLIVCGLFFLGIPTTYPRPAVPPLDNAFVAFAVGLVHSADTPNNCFPSMHVAITSTATWAARGFGLRWTALFVVWSLAIFVSTLTTKQHYFIDIVGGVAVTVFVATLELWYVRSRAGVALPRKT